MEDNKELLKISMEPAGIGVHWDVKGFDEMMGVCIALANCAKKNEAFLIMLLGAIREIFGNENFARSIEESCCEMPDFESILKEKNHE